MADTLAEIAALTPDALMQRLSGSRAHIAGFVREAAEAGSVEAQARFGQLLLDGDGVPADRGAGFAWLKRAALAGHLDAINMVGRCHDLGWGTAVDKVLAAIWFRRAALRGHVWGMYNYATLLSLGQGVREDRAEALGWLRKAAEAGNAKAMNFVGSFHEDGWATPVDLAEAARCYADAAAGGDFRGQFNHARMLIAAGRGDAARPWLERAWAGGNARFRGQLAAWLRDVPEGAALVPHA